MNYGGRVCSNRVVHADASPKTVAWPKNVHRRKKQVAERFSKEITVGFELFRSRTSEPITETNQLLASEASLSLVMSIELEIYFIYIFIYLYIYIFIYVRQYLSYRFTAKQKDKSTKRRCQMNAILTP